MPLLTMATYLKRNGINVSYLSLPQDEDLFEETVRAADFVYLWAKTAAYPNSQDMRRLFFVYYDSVSLVQPCTDD